VIEELIKRELLDYVAMDIKAPLERYSDIARVPVDTAAIAKSIELIKNSGLEYEFRTTLVQGMLSREELWQIADLVRGARRFYFQLFRNAPDLVDRSYLEKVPPDRALIEALIPDFQVSMFEIR
jgi:pyruvate formate lyase activating enzyme